MKALSVYATSRGKSSRNDDFVFHAPILNSRMLCVLGDFTSDSPKGANLRLLSSLQSFVEKRMATWREHLIPPQDILQLLAKFMNGSLAEAKGSEKTTLFACILDSYEQQLFFVNIGDSGFGLASAGGFTFLRKGDVGGARDASGFLPLESERFEVHHSPFPEHSVFLAFTDGFWENTSHVLAVHQAEARLGEVLGKGSLESIFQALESQILGHSNQRDDLTLILVKEEPMADSHGDGSQLSSAQLQALVEQKVLEAMDRQERMRPIAPSPMEAEFLSLLKASSGGLRTIERRITEQVQQENEQMHQRLIGQLQSQLGQVSDQIAQVAEQLKEQQLTFKARVSNAVSESTRDLRQLRDLAPLPDQLKETTQRLAILEKTLEQAQLGQLNQVDLVSMQRKLKSLEKRSHVVAQASAGSPSNAPTVVSAKYADMEGGDPWWKQRHLLWNAIHSGVLVFMLGWLIILAWRPRDSASDPALQGSETKTENVSTMPQKPIVGWEQLQAMSMVGSMPEVPWPQGLASLNAPGNLSQTLGMTASGFRQEVLILAKTLAREKAAIAAAENPAKVTERLQLPFEGGTVAGKPALDLFLRSSTSPANGTKLNAWLTEYVKSPNLYPPKEHLLGLWLQLHGEVALVDGDFGPGSQRKLKEVLQKRVNLMAVPALLQALEAQPGADAALRLAELTQKANAVLILADTGQLQKDIHGLKENLRDGQPLQIGQDIWVLVDAAPFRHSPLLLAKGQTLTPLGTAYLQIRANASTDEQSLLLAVLANRLGLPQADGDAGLLVQILKALRGKTLDQIIEEGKAAS